MDKKQEVIILVNPDGSLNIDVIGATGKTCRTMTNKLLDEMDVDAEIVKETPKDEMYVEDKSMRDIHLRNKIGG